MKARGKEVTWETPLREDKNQQSLLQTQHCWGDEVLCLCCYRKQCQVTVQSAERGPAAEKMGFGEEFCVHEQKELRDEKVTVTAAVKLCLGKRDLVSKVVAASLVAQYTWLIANAWKEKVNAFCFTYMLHPLHSVTQQAG